MRTASVAERCYRGASRLLHHRHYRCMLERQQCGPYPVYVYLRHALQRLLLLGLMRVGELTAGNGQHTRVVIFSCFKVIKIAVRPPGHQISSQCPQGGEIIWATSVMQRAPGLTLVRNFCAHCTNENIVEQFSNFGKKIDPVALQGVDLIEDAAPSKLKRTPRLRVQLARMKMANPDGQSDGVGAGVLRS